MSAIKTTSKTSATQPLEVSTITSVQRANIEAIALEAANAAVVRTTKYADEKFTELLNAFAAKFVEAVADSKSEQVLHVNISGTEKRLKSKAVPYLGRMIANAKLNLNTLLIGPAGSGKTFAASQLAESLDLPFYSLCLTAGASETWLFGRQTPNGFVEGNFSKAYHEGGVFLADEIDAADPNMLLAINTALANNILYNPINGELYQRHPNFVFVGAANTYGKGASTQYTGRNRLDASTLDRFVRIEVGYDKDFEKSVLTDTKVRKWLWDLRSELEKKSLTEVISSRLFVSVAKQLNAGIEFKDIFESIIVGWNKEAVTLANKLKEEMNK